MIARRSRPNGVFEYAMEETDLMNNPNLFGHGCILSAFGKGFEPKLFLQRTTFPLDAVSGFGNIGLPAEIISRTAEKLGAETAAELVGVKYLALEISKSGTLAVHHAAASEFLRRHREEILRLSQFSNVEQVNLRCVPAREGESLADYQYDELLELAEMCGLTGVM